MILQGKGIYRLGNSWFPVQAGDAIWMAPYVPQWWVSPSAGRGTPRIGCALAAWGRLAPARSQPRAALLLAAKPRMRHQLAAS